ncbi:MAG: PAS domain-containing protein [Bacteroidales bacterium]|nr:PAS domain-containing protein [Bacteroidales bacterium]
MIYLQRNEEFRYILINKANQLFFSKEESEIVGKTDFELMPQAVANNCHLSDVKAIQDNSLIITSENTPCYSAKRQDRRWWFCPGYNKPGRN